MADHISHSSLTKADACLRWYYETYLAPDRITDIANEAKDRGIGFHAFAEAHIKGEPLKWRGPTTEFAETNEIFERWKSRFDIPLERVIMCEREGYLHIEGLPPLLGYDDYGHIEIIGDEGGTPYELPVISDLKTGFSAEIKPEYAFQGQLACARFLEEYPEFAECAWRLDFPRPGVTTKPVIVTRKDLPRIIDRVKVIHAKGVEAKLRLAAGVKIEAAFPATPHSACGFCPARNECATRKRTEMAQLIVTKQESAEEALHTIALMQKSVESLKEALKPYVDTNGPIVLGEHGYDYVARYNQSVSTSRDPHAVAEIVPVAEWGKALKFDDKVKDGQRIAAMPEVQAITKAGKVSTRFYVGENKASEEK